VGLAGSLVRVETGAAVGLAGSLVGLAGSLVGVETGAEVGLVAVAPDNPLTMQPHLLGVPPTVAH